MTTNKQPEDEYLEYLDDSKMEEVKPVEYLQGSVYRSRALCGNIPESPGVVLLSRKRDIVAYIMRSDWNLSDKLRRDYGLSEGHPYKYFRWIRCSSAEDAYKKECEEYHRYGAADHLDNASHPKPPASAPGMTCPMCVGAAGADSGTPDAS